MASMTISLDRALLTPDFCQQLVVSVTPWKDRFNGNPDQDLSELGVVDANQASLHRARIQDALHKSSYSIPQALIETGPGVSVGDCGWSVVSNAH